MRVLAHISDLHFGRTDPAVVAGLVDDLIQTAPHLVVVSGDLTQRARAAQFMEARAFLDALGLPALVVPGNHDITPLHRPVRRFMRPFEAYQKFITADLAPMFLDEEVAVVGVNTALPHRISEGHISSRQLRQLSDQFSAVHPTRFKVVVTHHPFIPHPKGGYSPLVGRAGRALATLEACGVDLLLAGHLHHGFTGDVIAHHTSISRSILVVQASTSTSTRLRSDPNAYNHLTLGERGLELSVRAWDGRRFHEIRREIWCRDGGSWAALPRA